MGAAMGALSNMNKTVTPKQLELTAGKSREELLQATAPHIDFDGPAFKESLKVIDKIEKEEAARAVLGLGDKVAASSAPVSSIVNGPVMGSGFAFGFRADKDEFNWDSAEEDAVILREQRATAAYRNKAGELIIRQRASWDEERDTFVFISPENEVAFLEGLAKRARE
jgi:hypothetical protein